MNTYTLSIKSNSLDNTYINLHPEDFEETYCEEFAYELAKRLSQIYRSRDPKRSLTVTFFNTRNEPIMHEVLRGFKLFKAKHNLH